MKKLVDKKGKGFVIDDMDDGSEDIDGSEDMDGEVDREVEVVSMMNGVSMDMMWEIGGFYMRVELELGKGMCGWIIWIGKIDDVDVNEWN